MKLICVLTGVLILSSIGRSQDCVDVTFRYLTPSASSVTLPGEFNGWNNAAWPMPMIRYQLPAGGDVKLTVCDMLGREVSVLVNRREAAGTYTVSFNATGLSSGVYLYRLTAAGFTDTHKMVVVR